MFEIHIYAYVEGFYECVGMNKWQVSFLKEFCSVSLPGKARKTENIKTLHLV